MNISQRKLAMRGLGSPNGGDNGGGEGPRITHYSKEQS